MYASAASSLYYNFLVRGNVGWGGRKELTVNEIFQTKKAD